MAIARKISHNKTNYIKSFFILIGWCPLVLLSVLWNHFSLQGIQAVSMIMIVLAQMAICVWYASRFHNIVFDDCFVFVENNHAPRKIKLEHIDKVVPVPIAFPVFTGKVYPVIIYVTVNGVNRRIRFVSETVDIQGTCDDIPYLHLFRKAIARSKSLV